MRCGYFLSILALTSWMGVVAAGVPHSVRFASARMGRGKIIRQPPQALMCGPNVLYMFLKAHGRPIAADEFFGEVVPGEQGLSLAEMRDASTRYGLPAEIRRCTYEQLTDGCRLPSIVLLHPNPATVGRGIGHYVLVVDADKEEITAVDGTSGEQKRYSRDAVCRSWEGYVIVPMGGQMDWGLVLAIGAAAWLLVGWLILRLNHSGAHRNRSEVISKRRARCDSQVQSSKDGRHWDARIGTILVMLTIGQASVVADEPGGDFARWRSPERDGVHCLYIQLRLLGYTGAYEDVVAAVPGGAAWPSLGALAQTARRLGYDLAPVKLTVAELASRDSPTIILFEEAGLEQGRFHLLLGFSSTTAILVKGELVTRIEMPIDQFRRGWTGFALTPPPRSPWPGRWLGVTLGAVTASTIVWFSRRSARRLQHLASTSASG